MKPSIYAPLALAVLLSASCNKQKTEIDNIKDATNEAIDVQKAEVDAEARYATEQTELNAKIDLARIEANQIASQAQLDADKKRAEAEADAAKARLDAENQ